MADNYMKQRLRPWLIDKINAGECEGVRWIDQDNMEFSIPWKHGSKHDWNPSQGKIFKDWARHTGRYTENDKDEWVTWKTRLRCAFNKAPDIEEVKSKHNKDAPLPYKVYRFLPKQEKHKKPISSYRADRDAERKKENKIADSTLYALNEKLKQNNSSPSTPSQSPPPMTITLVHQVPLPTLVQSMAASDPLSSMSVSGSSLDKINSADLIRFNSNETVPISAIHSLEAHEDMEISLTQESRLAELPAMIRDISPENSHIGINDESNEHAVMIQTYHNNFTASVTHPQQVPVTSQQLVIQKPMNNLQITDSNGIVSNIQVPSQMGAYQGFVTNMTSAERGNLSVLAKLASKADPINAPSIIDSSYDDSACPGRHEMQLQILYKNRPITEQAYQHIEDPAGTHIFYGEKEDIPSGSDQEAYRQLIFGQDFERRHKIRLVDPKQVYGLDSKSKKYIDSLITYMKRGLILKCKDGSVYATRLCRTAIYYATCLTVDSMKIDRPNEGFREVCIFDYNEYLKALDAYKKQPETTHKPNPEIHLFFGQKGVADQFSKVLICGKLVSCKAKKEYRQHVKSDEDISIDVSLENREDKVLELLSTSKNDSQSGSNIPSTVSDVRE